MSFQVSFGFVYMANFPISHGVLCVLIPTRKRNHETSQRAFDPMCCCNWFSYLNATRNMCVSLASRVRVATNPLGPLFSYCVVKPWCTLTAWCDVCQNKLTATRTGWPVSEEQHNVEGDTLKEVSPALKHSISGHNDRLGFVRCGRSSMNLQNPVISLRFSFPSCLFMLFMLFVVFNECNFPPHPIWIVMCHNFSKIPRRFANNLLLLVWQFTGFTTMFSFMKKDKAEKRDKKERKETKKPQSKDVLASGAVYGAAAAPSSANEKLTADELLRLDEVRRSLKIRTRRKEKEKLPSGITADYTAHLGLNLEGLSGNATAAWPDPGPQLHSPISDGSTSEASLSSLTLKPETASPPVPPFPPIPPARGILKGKSSYGLESPPILELDDDNKLVENTLKNELIIYEKPPAVLGSKKVGPPTLPKPYSSICSQPANGASQREEMEEKFTYSSPRPLAPLDAFTAAAIAARAGLVPSEHKPLPPSVSVATAVGSTSPNSKPVLWREPPGEGCGWLDHIKTHKSLHRSSLALPPLVEPALPEPRDLTLQRKETGDFGFSLRRSVVVERSPNDPSR